MSFHTYALTLRPMPFHPFPFSGLLSPLFDHTDVLPFSLPEADNQRHAKQQKKYHQ